MILNFKNDQFELAVYSGENASPEAFAIWFETTFECELDYTNRDAFEDDFYWGLIENSNFSGIIHLNCVPRFFEDGFYIKACKRITNESYEKKRPLFFITPTKSIIHCI